jgi:hypothetical protein
MDTCPIKKICALLGADFLFKVTPKKIFAATTFSRTGNNSANPAKR